ncbi:MAG: contact-dependent growth inhibition system immunity protein [Flavobacteriales bacterium]
MFEKHIKKYGSRTIEDIEKNIWGEPEYDSYLVKTCHRLRKKQLQLFTVEDLRIMIGQNIGTEHLLPFALIQLSQNILSEGDFYPGDLVNSILQVDAQFWKNHPEYYTAVKELIEKNKKLLFENKIEYKHF